MPTTEMAEGTLVVFVNSALHVTANAAHQIISTPTTAAIEGVKSATVFVASHLIVGGIKLGFMASWWLITSAAAAVGAGTSLLAYAGFFGSSEPKCKPLSNNSADALFQENTSSPRSVAMDTTSPARQNNTVGPSLKPGLSNID